MDFIEPMAVVEVGPVLADISIGIQETITGHDVDEIGVNGGGACVEAAFQRRAEFAFSGLEVLLEELDVLAEVEDEEAGLVTVGTE